MAKKNVFKDAKLLIAPTTAILNNVADDTALAALVTPSSGDYAYVRSDGDRKKYSGSAWVDTTELDYGFVDAELTESTGTVDQTDSGTTGDNTESTFLRADITLTTNRIFKDSGGVKLTGKDMSATFDSVAARLTNFVLTETAAEVDVTDDSTADGLKEYELDRWTRTVSLSAISKNSEDDLALRDPATLAVTLVTSPSTIASATVFFKNKKVGAKLGGATTNDYDGEIQGVLTLTAIDALITIKRGWVLITGSGKTYSGASASINHTARTITCPLEGNITIAETFRVNTLPTMTKGS